MNKLQREADCFGSGGIMEKRLKTPNTVKIADLSNRECKSPDHNPPDNIYLDEGVYEHTCPKCGRIKRFIVSHPTL